MKKSKYWLAATSAMLLMTGAAYAQSSATTSETVTVSPGVSAPPVENYSATKTSRSVDAYGNEVDRSKSVERHETAEGDSVTRRSSESTTVAPMPAPPPVPSTTTSTTTTRTEE